MIEEPKENLAENIPTLHDLEPVESAASKEALPASSSKSADLEHLYSRSSAFDPVLKSIPRMTGWIGASKPRVSAVSGICAALMVIVGFVVFDLNREEWMLKRQYPVASSSEERHLLYAHDLMKENQHEEAVPILRKLVERQKSAGLHGDALLLLAECLDQIARDPIGSNEAREFYKKFAEDYPADPRVPFVHRTLAEGFVRNELYDEANEQYASLVRASPGANEDGEIDFLIAQNYYRERNLGQAIELLEQIRLRGADSTTRRDATLLLGEALYEFRKADDAKRILTEAVAEFPGTPHAAAALQLLARNSVDAGNHEDAVNYCVKWFKTSRQLYPQADVMLTLASAKLSAGMPAEAIAVTSDIGAFFSDSPKFVEALVLRGKAFEAMGQLDKAEGVYSQAAGIAPDDPTPHERLAQLYWLEGDLRTAITEMEAASKADPENDIFVFNRAKLYFFIGEKARATEMLEDFIRNRQLSSKIGEAGMLLANLQLEFGRPHDACKTLSRLLGTGTSTIEQSVVLEKQGDIYAGTGMYDEAARAYRTATDSSPKSNLARHKIARILLAAGRAQECLYELDSIDTSDCSPNEKLDLLGLRAQAHLDLKQFDESRHLFQDVLALKPEGEKISALALIMQADLELQDEKDASEVYGNTLRLVESGSSEAAPEARHIVLQWAQRLYEQGKYADAAKVFSIVRPPQFPVPDSAWAIYQEGNCYYRLADYKMAKGKYARLAKEFSNSEWVKFARQREEIIRLKAGG
ncbi:tetratricopeptide repeat protein [Candidatus Poribacteria bacterium]|nr:tetratricopeptide repeat protein [Candidatus Poribacteria bacterium]